MDATDSDPAFPRRKARSVTRSVAHRVQPLLRRTLGMDRTLRMLLHIERVSWRLAYENAALKYGDDFKNTNLALTPELLDRWVPAGGRVLDIGCGEGRTVRVLARRATNVLGIDCSEAAIRQARASDNPPNVSFEIGDAQQLTSGSTYDVVTLSHVLEHMDDPHAVLSAIAGITDVLIIEVPAFDRCVLNPVRRELGADFSLDDDHVREYTRPLLARQLQAAGWTVAEWGRSPVSIAALARKADQAMRVMEMNV